MKVLLLIARGLHLSYLGCYGNEWIDTPALDRLAAEGVVFDQHIADCADAAGARRAWRIGRYHLPLPDGDASSIPESTDDLLALLRARSVITALVTDRSQPGFDEFAAGWEYVEQVAGPGAPVERTLGAADAMLDRLAGQTDWLLVVELATLLPPWDVPEEFAERYFRERVAEGEEESEDEEWEEEPLTPLTDPPVGPLDDPDDVLFRRIQRSYAGAVTYLDRGVEALREALEESGLLDDLLLIVTSDHGQALGEHGIIGPHRPWLHDELIHLPLVVRLPGGAEAGRRVFALTQPVDLMPTLLDAFAVPSPEVHGRSLLPLLRGGDEPVRPYACSGRRGGGAVEWALRTPEWGFVLPVCSEAEDAPRLPQLYVKPDDRREVNNVLQHHLELGEHLEQVLRGFVAATRRPGPLQAPVLRDVETELTVRAVAPETDGRAEDS